MESLKEGVKFVFNNKTILGALSLDMIAVLFVELLHCCPFCTGYFVGTSGFGVLRAAPLLALLMLIISAYIPYKKMRV
jgi:hypothetical protein